MTISDAVGKILDEFSNYNISYDDYGHICMTWIITNNTEFSFDKYNLNIIFYDENDIIIEKDIIWIDCLPSNRKRKIKYTAPLETKSCSLSVYDYTITDIDVCEKERHVNDLYYSGIITSEEYHKIFRFLFADAKDCINQNILELNQYERKLAIINYFNSRGVFSNDEAIKIKSFLSAGVLIDQNTINEIDDIDIDDIDYEDEVIEDFE